MSAIKATIASASHPQGTMVHHFLKYWLPVLLCSTVMFLFSTSTFSANHTSQIIGPIIHWLLPHASHATQHAIHFWVRKMSHWTEYFILTLVIYRAFRGAHPEPLRPSWTALTFLLILLYALGDEFHQSFVPSRSASLTDSAIDLFGGSCALAWKYLRNGLRRETF